MRPDKATERLLRTVAGQGDTGAMFVWETGGFYRLAGRTTASPAAPREAFSGSE
ncbi:hypothetical protein [Streptomyces sp. NBC_01794]|uniref:hypothetical protein n=1 Tax=Streptomyces sp. NBC_01794 TaxID=2975942 RepID=UPI003085E865|nr:hypothetical protein OIE54_09605 [Streptomyces sp. NBC_01794]